MKIAYIGLGSNLGDRAAQLDDALSQMETANLKILRMSSRYETAPQDVTAQPWFLNMVVEAETRLFPRQLLNVLQRIERDMGRVRRMAKGPRVIDLDLLLYGSAIVQAPELTVPHPRLHERRFVLEPLAELAPGLRHPILRRTMRELLGSVSAQAVRRSTEPRP